MFPTPETFDLLRDAVQGDLARLLPELILCGAMVLMLFVRLFDSFRRLHVGAIALGAACACMAACARQWYEELPPRSLFSGLLINDSLALYGRLVLAAALALFVLLTILSRVPDRQDAADFHVLLFGSAVGMMLMAQASHLMTIFISIEMASVPSYVLAGFFKGNRKAGEAALKYVVYGAAASGTMLYGISLLTSNFGTGHLETIAAEWLKRIQESRVDPISMGGLGLVGVGLAFKLALVPFHFWCPDIFEGASAEIGGWLSVASKAAAFLLSARLLLAFCGADHSSTQVWTAGGFGIVLALVAAATCTLGNLAALGQSNVKRLLAYSTIAHAGYMFMGLASLSQAGITAAMFYLPAYLFLNLAAFACVCFLRNSTGNETISHYAGLAKREPLAVFAFAIALFGLLGLPPLVGFAAKFQIFAALYNTGQEYLKPLSLFGKICFGLLVIAGVNTIISAAYYLRLLRVMVLDEPSQVVPRPISGRQSGYLFVLAIAIVVGGILWNPLEKAARKSLETPLDNQKMRSKNYYTHQ